MIPTGSTDLGFGGYALALTLVGVVLTVLMSRTREDIRVGVTLFLGAFAFRLLMISVNEAAGLFDAKLAEKHSLEMFRNWMLNGWSTKQSTFIVQTFANFPGFMVLGPTRGVMLITSGFFGAMAGVIAYVYLARTWSRRAGLWGFGLLSLFPSVINFSLFGIRDIIIYFFMLANALAVARIWLRRGAIGENVLVFAIGLAATAMLRPEMAPIMLILPCMLLQSTMRSRVVATRNLGASGLYWYALAFLFIGSAAAAYGLWLKNIGVDDWVTPAYVAEVYASQRYERAVGLEFGAGTHILPPEIYRITPWYLRVPVQAIGIIVVPMPWLLTSIARVVAFVDSLLLMVALVMVVGRLRRRAVPPRVHTLNVWMVRVFFVAVAGMGFVISNGGNAFRMRITLLPYVMIPLAFYLGTEVRRASAAAAAPARSATPATVEGTA